MQISRISRTLNFRAAQPQAPVTPATSVTPVQPQPSTQPAEVKSAEPLQTVPASNPNAVSINIYDPLATNN